MGANWQLDNQMANCVVNNRKQRPHGFVYVSSIIFRFRKRTFWREYVSDLKCNNEIHLPLSLLKTLARETPVMFCSTQAAMLLSTVLHSLHQSLESLYCVVFSPPVCIL